MLTDQVTEVVLPSTSILRPRLHKGQIENQDQIHTGDKLVIHGPGNYTEKVTVIRRPFACGGCRCVSLSRNGAEEIVQLADLSVVRYQNRTWNIDYWLGKF